MKKYLNILKKFDMAICEENEKLKQMYAKLVTEAKEEGILDIDEDEEIEVKAKEKEEIERLVEDEAEDIINGKKDEKTAEEESDESSDETSDEPSDEESTEEPKEVVSETKDDFIDLDEELKPENENEIDLAKEMKESEECDKEECNKETLTEKKEDSVCEDEEFDDLEKYSDEPQGDYGMVKSHPETWAETQDFIFYGVDEKKSRMDQVVIEKKFKKDSSRSYRDFKNEIKKLFADDNVSTVYVAQFYKNKDTGETLEVERDSYTMTRNDLTPADIKMIEDYKASIGGDETEEVETEVEEKGIDLHEMFDDDSEKITEEDDPDDEEEEIDDEETVIDDEERLDEEKDDEKKEEVEVEVDSEDETEVKDDEDNKEEDKKEEKTKVSAKEFFTRSSEA